MTWSSRRAGARRSPAARYARTCPGSASPSGSSASAPPAPSMGSGTTRRRRPFDADVAIIDSGISRKHPDVTPAGGKDCSRSRTWGDGYGHGTGVASILGAKDNRQGIVGLLPGVRLWSVRIFDDAGRGKVSGVLCALDWMAGKRDPEASRQGLLRGRHDVLRGHHARAGTRAPGRAAKDAGMSSTRPSARWSGKGTILVAAAGNYGDLARQRAPAAYPEVIDRVRDGRLRRQAGWPWTPVPGMPRRLVARTR